MVERLKKKKGNTRQSLEYWYEQQHTKRVQNVGASSNGSGETVV